MAKGTNTVQFPCTIFFPIAHYDLVKSLLQAMSSKVDVEGPLDQWTRISVELSSGIFRVSSLKSRGPMDRLSTILLGLMNWVRRRCKEPGTVVDLSTRITSCSFAIGCVFEPTAGTEPLLERFTLDVAGRLHGIIFDGVWRYRDC
jgi:hypothetical protein